MPPQVDLFSKDNEHPFSVSAIVRDLKETVETDFGEVWIEGELSNFRKYRSGHCYFTLKDEEAQLRGVMFRGFTNYLFFTPEDGMLVRVHGTVTIYEARGELQVVARAMRLAGEGALQKAFDALKARLEAEGLFDPIHKKRLPPFPETIGIVTSGDGAALQDMLTVLSRRFPQVRVLVCPVRVQGAAAPDEIAEAIRAFNALPPSDAYRPDVLIIGRGGGSAEDLWAFNEERVARAIYDADIPIVSAVGHETDFAISDFVADLRAATPSMAAEVVTPDRRDVAALVRGYYTFLRDTVEQQIHSHRQHIHALTQSQRFHRPVDQLRQLAQRVDGLVERLHRAPAQRLLMHRQRLLALQQQLALLNPSRPMQQGYARVEKENQQIRLAKDLKPGDVVVVHFQDGSLTARVAGK